MKRFALFCYVAVAALAMFGPIGFASVAAAAGSSKLRPPVSGVKWVHTNQPFASGPHGWTCKASVSKTGLAYTGTCNPKSETFDARNYFAWTIG